jgi:hypothetical protein
MTKKRDNVKLNCLHRIKKRRMQKYHARKIIRAFTPYASNNNIWIKITRLFLCNQLHGRVRLELVFKE